MQLAGVACCGHGDKASLFIVRGQKPLTRTERERERDIRETMANLMHEEYHDVKVKPQLQKVNDGLNPKTRVLTQRLQLHWCPSSA